MYFEALDSMEMLKPIYESAQRHILIPNLHIHSRENKVTQILVLFYITVIIYITTVITITFADSIFTSSPPSRPFLSECYRVLTADRRSSVGAVLHARSQITFFTA